MTSTVYEDRKPVPMRARPGVTRFRARATEETFDGLPAPVDRTTREAAVEDCDTLHADGAAPVLETKVWGAPWMPCKRTAPVMVAELVHAGLAQPDVSGKRMILTDEAQAILQADQNPR